MRSHQQSFGGKHRSDSWGRPAFAVPRALKTLWAVPANRLLAAVDAQIQASVARAEAAERRLRIATGMADLYVFEIDYVKRTFQGLGVERCFFEQPPTFQRISDYPLAIVAPEHRASVETAWRSYVTGHGPYRAEFRVDRSDGRQVWAYVSGELLRDKQGRPLKLIGALQNITERKLSELEVAEALDRAEAGSRAKSEFLATMSHEIRTPLNGVLGMAQVMETHDLSPDQRARLGVVRKSGESLLVLLNNVLDVARIEAGALTLEIGEVDVGEAACAALGAFEEEGAAKGLELTLFVVPEARGVYAGDAIRVRQILYNLVSNAVKFTDRGRVRITVDHRPGEALTFRISDTGVGVPPERRAELFETFRQADASITRRHGGCGLGLSICRQLVEMMGGEISLESEAGRGTTVSVTLPLPRLSGAVGVSSDRAGESAPPGDGPRERRPMRMLAAEDNPVNQAVLRALLHPFGVDPVLVGDGQQALAAWRDGAWDLILMDIQMPMMDGVAAARAIRQEEQRRGGLRTPIIALTANVMPHQVQAYRAAGIDDVVGKPIEMRRLLAAIEAALAGSGGAQAGGLGFHAA